MNKILIIIMLSFLVGCSTTKNSNTQDMTNLVVELKNKNQYFFPSDDVLKQCDELPLLKGNLPSDLYKWGIDSSYQYNQCKNSKKTLSDWIINLKKESEK